MKYNVRMPVDEWIDVIVDSNDADEIGGLAMEHFNRSNLEIDNFSDIEVSKLDCLVNSLTNHSS